MQERKYRRFEFDGGLMERMKEAYEKEPEECLGRLYATMRYYRYPMKARHILLGLLLLFLAGLFFFTLSCGCSCEVGEFSFFGLPLDFSHEAEVTWIVPAFFILVCLLSMSAFGYASVLMLDDDSGWLDYLDRRWQLNRALPAISAWLLAEGHDIVTVGHAAPCSEEVHDA